MGYGGKYNQVKETVRELLRVKQEVFMPLVHRVGEAQVDFGYALAKLSRNCRIRIRNPTFYPQPHATPGFRRDLGFLTDVERSGGKYFGGKHGGFPFLGFTLLKLSGMGDQKNNPGEIEKSSPP